jgi:four helix bundle protein
MRDFRELVAWQKSRQLVCCVYELTESYPSHERFGLTVQTRRAAISISANLAEGCGRRGSREFARFVDIALGSLYEVESHLYLAIDLGFTDAKAATEALMMVGNLRRLSVRLSEQLHHQRAASK